MKFMTELDSKRLFHGHQVESIHFFYCKVKQIYINCIKKIKQSIQKGTQKHKAKNKTNTAINECKFSINLLTKD